MKKTVVAIMASLMVAVSAQATDDPIGTLREAQRPPQSRITLQNDVVTVVTQVILNRGRWMVSGGCTVQDTVLPGVNGFYIYTYSAFSIDPDHINLQKSLVGVDARPYNTWWFSANPTTRSFGIQQDNTRVYLLVKSYGQVPPALSQAFGSITALKVAN